MGTTSTGSAAILARVIAGDTVVLDRPRGRLAGLSAALGGLAATLLWTLLRDPDVGTAVRLVSWGGFVVLAVAGIATFALLLERYTPALALSPVGVSDGRVYVAWRQVARVYLACRTRGRRGCTPAVELREGEREVARDHPAVGRQLSSPRNLRRPEGGPSRGRLVPLPRAVRDLSPTEVVATVEGCLSAYRRGLMAGSPGDPPAA